MDREKKLAAYRRYHASHADELRPKYKAYNDSHKEERKAWRIANAERSAVLAAAGNRRRDYGVTPEMFEEYLDAQEGCCAYCGNELPKNRSKIAVDHDHETGVFRGLMHIPCNGALGFAEAHYDGFMASVRGGFNLGY
jgi:hypothetical protein